MSDAIIKVRDLGKSYLISHEGQKENYTALRDVITNQAKKFFSFPKNLRVDNEFKKATTEEFWALKDLSFDIQQGDRVGIIGRNGAGKSTLLKILSRITEPTKGEIRIKGRVASLLEVGTGFHPELTGRENIYLNGAILGMSRAEIRLKFDEIVDFAEVEKFLDTPVKRYSSGMYVRLAFAVAAHLEPEILIVDEVLAVGDAQFQKKCLGKMEDVSKSEGRTVLFVSHNLTAVNSFCNKAIYLKQGNLINQGNTFDVLKSYQKSYKSNGVKNNIRINFGNVFVIEKFDFFSYEVQALKPNTIIIELKPLHDDTIKAFAVFIANDIGQRISLIDLRDCCFDRIITKDKLVTIKIEIESLSLIEGDYYFGLYYEGLVTKHGNESLIPFTVTEQKITSGILPYNIEHRGFVILNTKHKIQIGDI